MEQISVLLKALWGCGAHHLLKPSGTGPWHTIPATFHTFGTQTLLTKADTARLHQQSRALEQSILAGDCAFIVHNVQAMLTCM